MRTTLKSIYKFIPLKKELYSLIKKIYKPKKNLYQHLHFTGNIIVKVDDLKSFRIRHHGYEVENEIFWNGIYGGWEKHSLRIWKELCATAETIFDIGANTGVYALLAQTVKPNSNVYAFEPVERVFKKLEYNVNLNGFDIKCIKKAVSNFDGKATIYDSDSEHIYSVTVNKNTNPQSEKPVPVEIETIKLDSFIKQEGITSIDLMKIDVETHEVEVLEGFREYIHTFQPSMLIEVLNEEVASGIQELIDGIDYVFFNIDENTGIRMVPKLSKSDYYNFLICKRDIAEKLNSLK